MANHPKIELTHEELATLAAMLNRVGDPRSPEDSKAESFVIRYVQALANYTVKMDRKVLDRLRNGLNE